MKNVEAEMNDELRAEYDLRTLRVRKLGPGRRFFKEHYEITDLLSKKYPEVFSRGTDLEVTWRNARDLEMMLDMLRESNYGPDYCLELITFIKHTECLTGETYADHGALTSSECQSNREQFELLLMRAEMATQKATNLAKDDEFWDGRMPKRSNEIHHQREKPKIKLLPEKLRELIRNPFLPKIS